MNETPKEIRRGPDEQLSAAPATALTRISAGERTAIWKAFAIVLKESLAPILRQLEQLNQSLAAKASTEDLEQLRTALELSASIVRKDFYQTESSCQRAQNEVAQMADDVRRMISDFEARLLAEAANSRRGIIQ